jgi:hypothetical protein
MVITHRKMSKKRDMKYKDLIIVLNSLCTLKTNHRNLAISEFFLKFQKINPVSIYYNLM